MISSGRATDPHARSPICPAVVGVGMGLAALVLYAATALTGVAWQDSGVHQYRILVGAAESPYGLALSHPLHHWLGVCLLRLLPDGVDPATALNQMSAFWGAVGIGCLAALVECLTRRTAAALLGGSVAMLGHAYWQMSCMTETYTLASALMVIEWLLLVRFCRTGRPAWLVAVMGVNGLHVADHLLGLLPLAVYGVLWLVLLWRGQRRESRAATANELESTRVGGAGGQGVASGGVSMGWAAAGAASWLAGAAPYWTLVADHYARTGDLIGTLYSTFFGAEFADEVLNARLSWRLIQSAAMVFFYNFPSLAAAIGAWGLIAAIRGIDQARTFRDGVNASSGGDSAPDGIHDIKRGAESSPGRPAATGGERWLLRILAAQSALIALFVLRYSIHDQYTFYVPVCAAMGLWFGIGSDRMLARVGRVSARRGLVAFLAVNALLPLPTYMIAPEIARERGWLNSRLRELPFRDRYSHFMHPWKRHDRSAAQFADAALHLARPGDWLLLDMTTAYTTAFVCRRRGSPAGIRIYAFEKSVDEPSRVDLAGKELRRFIEGGGRAWALMPSGGIERQFGAYVGFQRTDELLWRVTSEMNAP